MNWHFWDQVDASGDCWIWTQSLDSHGYGKFWHSIEKRKVPAHRFAWKDMVGPLRSQDQLDHLCRRRSCVNPDHLRVVTQKENLAAGYGMSGKWQRAKQCPRGHEWNAENTYIYPNSNKRYCRACKAFSQKQRRLSRTHPSVAMENPSATS